MSTHLVTSRTAAVLPAIGPVIAARVAQIVTALINRRSVQTLDIYDERMLKDIGLTRSDIVAALDVPLYADPSCHLRKVAAGRGRPAR